MNKYHVTIEYMNFPAFRAVLQADSEHEALEAADRESPYPRGSMYIKERSKVELRG